MKILFDQGTPQPLRQELGGHVVDTVYEQGWSTLKNGVLLATAEQASYDLFITIKICAINKICRDATWLFWS